MEIDYYNILGVSPVADQDEIKSRYRFLAMAFHPDRYGKRENHRNQAEEQLKLINEAFEILGNETSRRQYDQSRSRRNSADPSTLSELKSVKSTLRTVEAEREKAVAEIQTLKQQNRKLEQRLAEHIRQAERERENNTAKLADYEKHLDAFHNAIQQCAKEKLHLAQRNSDLSNELEEVHRSKAIEIERLSTALSSTERKLAEVTEEFKQYRERAEVSQEKAVKAAIQALEADYAQLKQTAALASEEEKARVEALNKSLLEVQDLLRQERLAKEELNRLLATLYSTQQQWGPEGRERDAADGVWGWQLGGRNRPRHLGHFVTIAFPALVLVVITILFLRSLLSPDMPATQSLESAGAGSPSTIQTASPQAVGTPNEISPTAVATAPGLQPAAQPTATATPTQTPRPTPTPTVTPTPSPTPFFYPTLAYNYETLKGERWVQYTGSLVGTRVTWTGRVTAISWWSSDISVEVGQDDWRHDVTLEFADDSQRSQLQTGDVITFHGVVKSVKETALSLKLETRLSEIEILTVEKAEEQ